MATTEEPVVVVVTTQQPTTEKAQWTSEFHCWDSFGCGKDLPLFCYTCLCPHFAWAEVMNHLGQEAKCCPNANPLNAHTCASLTAFLQTLLMNAGTCCCVASALLPPLVWFDSRNNLAKRGLPVDDCCGPYGAYLFCGPCALYQEAVHVKHSLRKDFECCCYSHCTQFTKDALCCSAPEPGAYGGSKSKQGYAVMTTQPGEARESTAEEASSVTNPVVALDTK